MFLPSGLDDFLIDLHVEGGFGLGEVVDADYELDYVGCGLGGEVEEVLKLLVVLAVSE